MRTLYIVIFSVLFSGCNVLQNNPKTLKLAFGSCTNQAKINQLWTEILNEKPDAFIFTGDAVYPETYDLESLKKAYQKQTSNADYQLLKKNANIFGVYDDHDYGLNDGGRFNPIKTEAKNLFIEYMINDEISTSKNLKENPNGLFYTVDYPQLKTQVIVLDTRYNRSDLKKSSNPKKRYEEIEEGEILGNKQWSFLENEIKYSPFNKVVIISSIQFLNMNHHYEKWGNIKSERNRLINLINQNPNKQIVVVSGDRHFSEVSRLNQITEITSSGLTEVATMANESNPFRISGMYKEPNFGLITISKNQIYIELIGKNGKRLYELRLNSLHH